MKMNKITLGLMAAGLVSSASAAITHPTVVIGGVTYTEVFITGSSAARANIFNALNTAHGGAASPDGTGGVFDAGSFHFVPATTGTGTSTYDVYGTINGTPYCLCVAFSGSEAGIAAAEHLGTGIANPILANTLHGNAAYSDAVIPNTPNVSYIDPNTLAKFTAAANLATADTSQQVSLTPTPALDDFGVVGAVTFVWAKGRNSAPTAAYNNLVNVTDMQMNVLMSSPNPVNFLTGKAADASNFAFVCGRNRASGTHQNTGLDTLHGPFNLNDQWVPSDCFYSDGTTPTGVPHGQLQNGPSEPQSLTLAGGITEVFNDGFESGGNVQTALRCDEAGAQSVISQGSDSGPLNIILLGYLSINDTAALVAAQPNAILTLNGNVLNDGNVINGTYSFWGHEHLFGEIGAKSDAVDKAIGEALAGNKYNLTFTAAKATPPNGAIERAGGLGGTVETAQSGIIKPDLMNADKPSGLDSGYPSLQ
jgi:hypothetical protein